MSCRLAKLGCCRFQQGLQCSQTGFLHCCVPWTAKLFQWCDLINCRILQALQKKHIRLEAPHTLTDDSETIFSLSILQHIILALHKPIHHMFYLFHGLFNPNCYQFWTSVLDGSTPCLLSCHAGFQTARQQKATQVEAKIPWAPWPPQKRKNIQSGKHSDGHMHIMIMYPRWCKMMQAGTLLVVCGMPMIPCRFF